MPIAVTEKEVLEIWQNSLQRQTDLKTGEDGPVKIIYPGRRNDGRGADFKDAVIATRQGQFKGDIEIHVKASHWWTHHHHRDPAYNRVILHVVYRKDTAKAIVMDNGFKVPTLALDNYSVNNSPPLFSSMPCRGAGCRGNIKITGNILDAAGDTRFVARAKYFQAMTTHSGAGQALYQGIMTALGYSKNKEAMAELARRMPLTQLETTALQEAPESEYLAQCQARLLGTAGLLPSQRKRQLQEIKTIWEARLENIWKDCGGAAQMSVNDWHFFKVRPGNYPVRRIAAMSHLLLRFRKSGLLSGLEAIFKELTVNEAVRRLENALVVEPESYRGHHLDFGVPVRVAAPALLGKERAADIIVNVVLPFIFAGGLIDYNKKAMEIYRHYHTPSENTLVRHMRQQLELGKTLVNTVRRQQGLIHIYKTLCSQGKCNQCPMNKITR